MEMFHKFHRKMTLLYTLTTGLILTLVLAAILIYSEKLLTARSAERFQAEILTLVSRLQSQDPLSQKWLSQMESENDLLIHIEDNRVPLLFQGSWNPLTSRDFLISKAKLYAAQNDVDTSILPVSSGIQQSDIFQLQGKHQDFYQVIVIKLPYSGGYKNLVLLNSLQSIRQTILRQRLFFAVLDIIGILALFAVSWKFVQKSLKPIQESKKQQDAFIAAASHELRSPIAVIQASANAISASPAEAKHLSANIVSECRRISRLVEDLSTLASADTAKWSVTLAPVDVDTLLLDAYELYENVCLEKKISLSLRLPDAPLPAISGDRERLLQLLAILLDNAISYSGTAASICLTAHAARHYVYISVIDHGAGIPDEKKALIFHRFYRADASRNDKSHFGLGLSIASELARLHKGKLSVSDTEGGGSTFTLKLPSKNLPSADTEGK